jgi:hypothetical protein|tara:strand:- start:1692 stop:2096 length:405 start_codon:yes stop_codon:yes gene_type:complete
MTVKVVRMVNGEDVIADIKEIRKDEETPGAVAYMFDKPYAVQILEPTEMLFEERASTEEPQKVNELDLKFYPYCPLSNKPEIVVAVHQVALIYDPHPSVSGKYLELIKAMENNNAGNFEVDYTHQPPVPSGEGN